MQSLMPPPCGIYLLPGCNAPTDLLEVTRRTARVARRFVATSSEAKL